MMTINQDDDDDDDIDGNDVVDENFDDNDLNADDDDIDDVDDDDDFDDKDCIRYDDADDDNTTCKSVLEFLSLIAPPPLGYSPDLGSFFRHLFDIFLSLLFGINIITTREDQGETLGTSPKRAAATRS